MATTRLMSIHTGKGRTVEQAISDIIDYTENPQKTDGGRLITSWQRDSRIADAEFCVFPVNSRKGGQRRGYSVTNSASEEVGSNVSCTVGTERVFST